MNLKKFNKAASRYFAWLALSFCSFLIRLMPRQSLYPFARGLARIGLLFAVRQRRIALESLSIAFGRQKSDRVLKGIAKDCFSFMAKSAVEVLYFMRRPQLLKSQAALENKHILDQALSRGNGVILVSGHFGNFPLMILRLAVEGYRVGGIMRLMRDQRVEKMFGKLRTELGIKTIHTQPRKACVEATISALRNNEIVCIQLDQNFGSGGVFVDFFGQKAATATGPVVFALRTNAAIIPCFIIRQKDDTHRIIFEQEFNLRQEENFDKMVLSNIQALTSIIESYIRRYPDHWGWVHRRWKTKPK